jgi:hypothetical protein
MACWRNGPPCGGRYRNTKLEQAGDVWIEKFDPAAVRRTQTAARNRDVTVGDRDDVSGTASFWGRLLATDATVLQRRLAAMAHSVCQDDPRTMGQRRADALGALAAGSEHMACMCGTPACPANADDGRAANVVIHIVADLCALTAEPDPAMHGEDPTPTRSAKPAQVRRPAAGVIIGGPIVPAPDFRPAADQLREQHLLGIRRRIGRPVGSAGCCCRKGHGIRCRCRTAFRGAFR